MEISSEKLKELLVKPGHIDKAQFESAVQETEREEIPLERLLVERGLISDDNLGKIIADNLGYQFINLKRTKITDELLQLIPEVVARAQEIIAFEVTSGGPLRVATSKPENYEFFKLLEKKIGYKVEVFYTTHLGIDEGLKHYKSDLKTRVEDFIEKLKDNPNNEKSIVGLVDVFLEYAHDNRASDIHLEPLEHKVSVRFRIDGALHEVVRYPKDLHDRIVFRVKIISRLRTDEHAEAQDGRFSYKRGDTAFDVRVSVVPITSGENIVMRLLSGHSRRTSLDELGLSGDNLKKVKKAAMKPYGMILVVGPTGSGKTTTLYSILHTLNKPEVNIMTIEDPVEYNVEHIQQIQVNSRKSITFATGLRSIVRQDPDIIMVGEIRDNETADIAVNSAMTGHLVLSTMHANDAATTFPRLLEMGVEPFLVASGLDVVVAQRLVRRICEQCRVDSVLDKDELKVLETETDIPKLLEKLSGKKDFSKIRVYKGEGKIGNKKKECPMCGGVGYIGRVGIFEVIEVTDEIRSLITQKVPAGVIDKKAKELGMVSLIHDGINKVLQGITSLEEIIRVTK